MPVVFLIALLLSFQAAGVHGQQLTRAIDIRSLPFEQAATGVPVRLRGIVGFIEVPGTVFVQDETGGTFFRTKARLDALRIGDVVEVNGVSFPGLYLTGIEAAEFKVIDHGPPPEPQPAGYDDLASGRFHYQRVQAEGVGRRLTALEENRSLLHLALGGRVIEVRVDAPPTGMEVLDARLRITALAAGGINDRRQLVFPYLRVADWKDVTVTEAAPQVEELPVTPAARLLRFGTLAEAAHRVRVRGVVLASFPDGRIFVRDASPVGPASAEASTQDAEPAPSPVALAVRLVAPAALSAGQTVDVAGFPNMEGFSASLADAILLQVSDEPAPVSAAPVTVDSKSLLSGSFDADLVTLSATLTDVLRAAGGSELRLFADDTSLTALLPAMPPAPGWETGARVQVTGICRIESSSDRGFRSHPERAHLLLRSADDVRVLQAPTWWTARRLLIAVGVLLAGMLLAGVWISLLRRQVSKQERALRRRITAEAALEERQRIAREFHDTLEQELAGLSIRLDAAATRPLEDKARGLLEASRHLVSRIQTEARNLVADLRAAPEAAEADLPAALRTLIERLPLDDKLAATLDVETPLPALPGHVAHQLRMIAQEAVTNAMKHGQAGNIRLHLSADSGALRMTIDDDGRGFDPATDTVGKAGHFGCMGIRERCRKIGAQVEWRSSPGTGTTVHLTLPL